MLPYCKQLNGQAEQTQQSAEQQPAYQPAPIVQTAEKEKTKVLLPVLAMVLIPVSYFTIILVGVPLGVAALVIAIVALAQQRSKLSVASMIVTAVLFVLLILSVIAVMIG